MLPFRYLVSLGRQFKWNLYEDSEQDDDVGRAQQRPLMGRIFVGEHEDEGEGDRPPQPPISLQNIGRMNN